MVAKETGLQSRKKQAAYLVAVSGQGLPAAVYAVIAQTPEAALAALQEQSANAHQLEIVGALSRDLARKINLRSGPLKLIETKASSWPTYLRTAAADRDSV